MFVFSLAVYILLLILMSVRSINYQNVESQILGLGWAWSATWKKLSCYSVTRVHFSPFGAGGAVEVFSIWAASRKTNKKACASIKDSDQPGHPPRLIRVFAVCLKKHWALSFPNERTAKTLIRLGGCPGWSVFAWCTVILLVLSWGGSYTVQQNAKSGPNCLPECCWSKLL